MITDARRRPSIGPAVLSILAACLAAILGAPTVDGAAALGVSPALHTATTAAARAPVATPQAPASSNPIARDLRWRNIGPANMMGRIAAIEALSTDYRHVLVASASGGVFKSLNAGITWDPIFDNSGGAGSIGAVAMFEPDPDIIWVGTGEAANRNSSGWGDGIYKTTDGGATWEHLGLEATHHIAEIALHPSDPDIAYAASPGHLWGYSGDRGLFKTTDGGATWTKLGGDLPDDGTTGATEIIMDPRDPDVLFAGMYHRIRQPASMYSGGPAGGIFKSTDAGATWTELTNGLAEGETGMIDLSIHLADPDIMVAAYEADEDIPFDEGLEPWEQTPGTGIYISEDAGESWKWILRTHTRPFYHGQVQIDPNDPDRIFSVGRQFQVTLDGGETWRGKWWGGGGDDHDFWIAPYDSSIFYTATDQGAHVTVDDGQTVLSLNNMAIGQYYKIGVDMRDPYWVIGGLQDNALWTGPSNSRETRGILNMHNTWLGEGDGFASLVDPTDYRVIYMVNHVGFRHAPELRNPRAGVHHTDTRDGDQLRRFFRRRLPGRADRLHDRSRRALVPLRKTAAPTAAAALPLQLEQSADDVAEQPSCPVFRRQPSLQVGRPGRHLADHQPRPDQQ